MASSACIRPLTAPVEVRDAGPGKGRGVFATAPIARGTLIEVVPVIVLSKESYELHGCHTELSHYTFCWPGGGQAVALGMAGSMWNHRRPPNVGFVRDVVGQTIAFSAVEPIARGEECCIDYGRNLWFPCDEEGGEDLDDDSEADFLARCLVDPVDPDTRATLQVPPQLFESNASALVRQGNPAPEPPPGPDPYAKAASE